MLVAMMATRVLLMGMMGSGKTTVGRLVASRLGWPYLDNDELVAEVAGRATPDVAGSEGGEALHEIERRVVEHLLTVPPPLVSGIPGSAVLDPALRDRLRRSGHPVWLRARLETLAARIGSGDTRPFFAGRDVLDVLTELDAGRDVLYAEVACQVVDVDDLSPADVAAAVVAALGEGASDD
jgi:shikimate kinase